MRKYIIVILITVLIVAKSIFFIQSQIEEENKNMINKTDEQVIVINQPLERLEPTYIIMQATAYTKSAEEQTKKGVTKSGTKVSRGTVSVDPRVIPLGTKLYIEGYGYAVALDTGGDIKHDRIDLYMETKKEAFEFGRQDVKVWIIE